MTEQLTTISPSTNKPILTRPALSTAEIALLPDIAQKAFEEYRSTTFEQRQTIVGKALDILASKEDELAKELTEQMGRPIAYTGKEISTAVARGKYLLKISTSALKDTEGESENGYKRWIKKVPVGPVLVIFAWNVRSI